MKKLIPVLLLILSITVAVGAVTFLSPCVHEDGSFGACHWAGQVLLGLGCLMGLESLISIILQKAKMGLYLACGLTAALGLFVPGPRISLCRMSTMRCQAVMKPGMTLLCAGTLLLSAIGMILEWRKGKRP